MRLILFGPPGVGKGTQAMQLEQHYRIIHLSTGEILRAEIADKTDLGLKAKVYMDQGQLVPDDILLHMMEHRIQQPDCEPGYLLDGFPRTIPQAEGFDVILEKDGHVLDAVVYLYADDEELVQRLLLRGKTSGRSDDTIEVIRNRQEVYRELTFPLLEFYRQQNLLIEVNGSGAILDITQRIIKELTAAC